MLTTRSGDALIRLRTLGAADLRTSDDRVVEGVLAQPKRFALLAYLAAASPPRLHRRDSLLAMFWPELDQAHARDALNSAVRFLRRGLGDHVIITRGADEIGIDPVACWCDVVELREDVAAGRNAEALALYRGDLLAGLHLNDAGGFDEWLERERAALRAEASRVAQALSRAASNDGDATAAVAYARRALDLAADDERVLRHLLALLDGAGDRVGAIQTYESHARRVADEYNAEPAPETRDLIARIRERSSARDAALPNVDAASRPAERDSLTAGLPVPPRGTRSSWKLAGATIALAAIALVGSLVWVRRTKPVADASIIAVLPFRVTGADSSLNYLRDGIIDLANAELTGDGVPRPVDTRTVLTHLHGLPSGRSVEIDPDAARTLARRLGAAHVLLGDVIGGHGKVTGTARLIRVSDGRVIARHAETGWNELDVMRRLLRGVMALAGGESRERLRTVSDSAEAVRAYLAGMTAFRAARYGESVAQLRKAVGIDSAFALGWLWLATASQYTGADHLYARRRAWALRDHLSAGDRTYLAAIHDVSPRTVRRKLEAFADAAMQNPGRAEVWRMWSVAVGMEGGAAGLDDWSARAVEAADSAIALDSSLAPAIEFRIELALRAHDRDYLATTAPALLVKLPSDGAREIARWAIAHQLGDSATVESIRNEFPRLARSAEWNTVEVAGLSVTLGFPMHDVERVATLARRNAVQREALGEAYRRLREIAAIRGEMRAARAYTDSLEALGTGGWYEPVSTVMLGMAEPGFEDAARRAAAALDRIADTTHSRAHEAIAICHSQLWRLSRHDTTSVRAAIERLKSAERSIDANERWWWVDDLGVCSLLLEAALEAEGGFRTRIALEKLDDVVSQGLSRPPVALALLLLSRWHEASGDRSKALDVLRRRLHVSNAYYFLLEPRYLREEGRLAAVAHDTVGARRAYQHFLVLRDRPDAGSIDDDVRRIRAQLAELR